MPPAKPDRVTGAQWRTLAVLAFGTFLGALDIAVVSPALHTIGRELGIGGREISWVITLYLVVYMISTPTMAVVSDRWGRRRTFAACIGVFGLGSLVAGTSVGYAWLLAGRAVQAVGAGGLFPIANTVAGEVFPPRRRGAALGVISVVWGIAAIVGPPSGGWLTEHLGWRSVFFINVPLAAVALLPIRTIPASGSSGPKRSFDAIGIALLGAGVAALAFGLNRLDSTDLLASIASPWTWPWIVGGLAALGVFALVEHRSQSPAVPVGMFRSRGFDIGMALSLLSGVVTAGLVYLPAYASEILNANPTTAGLLVLATAATVGLLTAPLGWVVDWAGPRVLLVGGAGVTALGAGLVALAGSVATFIGFQIVLGVGLSALLGAPIRYLVFAETDPEQHAAGQALMSDTNSLGILIGSALFGAFVGSHAHGGAGYREAYLMVAAAAAAGALLGLLIRPGRRRDQDAG